MSPYLDQPGPIALAHRGGGAETPENSRAAVEGTLALGYRYLETDVRATADGVVVLHHDARLERTTDGEGPISARTWADVARLRDASGRRPVRLDEVLADFGGLRLNIDAKDDGVVAPLLRVIDEAGAHERVCLASFSDARLRRIRTATGGAVATSLGQAECARLVLAARGRGRLAGTLARAGALRWGVPVPDGPPAARAVCVQVPERYRGVPVVTPRFLALAHRLGLAVHVWTVDDAADMHRLLDLGVDGLVTDRPTTLRAVLRERGQWHEGL
ncbi:glycerophosphodiester phosphodiesterase [Georgenia sp. MJ206]|uniref:glycerophosphodiester phosphodiesterase n=1 Tax=Georgenia wangjunii TaxID=3117730 RepID=UPI002F26C969